RKFELYQGSDFPIGAEVTMRIQGAGFWSNPKIYPWLVAPFLIVGALIYAAKKGRGRAEGWADPVGAARSVDTMPFAAPTESASRTAAPPSLPDDDFAAIYLFLIDALDRGLERGEFSKESHALVR